MGPNSSAGPLFENQSAFTCFPVISFKFFSDAGALLGYQQRRACGHGPLAPLKPPLPRTIDDKYINPNHSNLFTFVYVPVEIRRVWRLSVWLLCVIYGGCFPSKYLFLYYHQTGLETLSAPDQWRAHTFVNTCKP